MPPRPRSLLLAVLLGLVAGCTAAPAPTAPESTPASGGPSATASGSDRPSYAVLQAALAERSAAETALTKAPIGKRDWTTVSAGYLPAAEKYEDRRIKAMKEVDIRGQHGLESVLAWTADGSTVVVSESAGSGAAYRLAVYRWNSGHPVQLFRMPMTPFSRVHGVADGVAQPAASSTVERFVAYRSKGTRPAKVDLSSDEFIRFGPSIDKKSAPHFTESVRCAVPKAFGAPVAWQLPTDSGRLTLAAVRCQNRLTGKGGWRAQLGDRDLAITGDKRYFSRQECTAVFPMSESVVTGGNTGWQSPQELPLSVCKTR